MTIGPRLNFTGDLFGKICVAHLPSGSKETHFDIQSVATLGYPEHLLPHKNHGDKPWLVDSLYRLIRYTFQTIAVAGLPFLDQPASTLEADANHPRKSRFCDSGSVSPIPFGA